MALCALAAVLTVAHAAAKQAVEHPDSKKPAASESAGQQVFSSICASCHGLDGKGAERGPDIVTRAEITLLSDDDMLKILRFGVPGKGMPPFAALGNPKLSAVMKYLRGLQGSVALARVAGDPTLGKEIFYGKAKCSECHMVNGAGGFLGPELSTYAQSHSSADIRSAIVSPEKNASPRHPQATVSTKDGQVYEGLVRNEDNFSVQLQSSDGAFHLFGKNELSALEYRHESLMPANYGSKLSAAELNALVAYLTAVAQEKGGGKRTVSPKDEL